MIWKTIVVLVFFISVITFLSVAFYALWTDDDFTLTYKVAVTSFAFIIISLFIISILDEDKKEEQP